MISLLLTTCISVAPLNIDPAISSLEGTFSQSIHMPGTLIGDYDAKTNPEGTMTRPGVWGGSGNEPVSCTIEPVLGGDFGGQLNGTVDFEWLSDELMTLSELSLSAFEKGQAIPLNVIFEYETFRSIAPDSLFVGGFPIEIPLGEGMMTSLTIDLPVPFDLALKPINVFEWSFSGEVPVIITTSFTFFETDTGPIPTPAILTLQGSIVMVNDERIMYATSSWDVSETVEEPPFYFDNLPLELPTIVPPGDFAGVLLSVAADEATSTATGDLAFTASGHTEGVPGDANGDGEVNVSDVLAVISAWGTCDGCPEDLNDDGAVNVTDLLDVIANWS